MEFTGERFVPDCGLDSEIVVEHLQRYLAVQEVVASKKVLDVASGAGYGSALLAEKAEVVCGLDIDRQAIEFAAQKYRRDNLRYCRGSIVDLPFADNSFEVIVSFETIEHIGEELHERFLEEAVRVLSPDGFMVISTPDRHIYSELPGYHNEFHLKEYYRKEFNDFLSRYFPHVTLLDQFQELTYALTDHETDNLRVLRHGKELISGKYLIAVCGRRGIPDPAGLCNVIFDTDSRFQQKVDRVIELQGEIVEKNGNIADCWDMIHDRDDTIKQLKERQEQERRQLSTLSGKMSAKSASLAAAEDENCRLRERLDELQEKSRKVSAELNHIKNTRSWKFIQKLYWLKSVLCH